MFAKQQIKNALKLIVGERRYAQIVRKVVPRKTVTTYGERVIVQDIEAGAELLRSILRSGKPAAIGKIGASELRVCREAKLVGETAGKEFTKSVKHEIHLHSGLFPPTDKVLADFARRYEADCAEIDLLAAWFIEGEQTFVDQHVPRAQLIRLVALEPHMAPNPPWTSLLAGKRVVVVSPFARSIESQYARREAVWAKLPGVLPDWKLRTVKAPLSDFLVKSPYGDWFEALTALEAELAKEPFDVAIIGAGAFSIPLAVKAKRLGAVGIHLGGATQIMFGVAGGRWQESDVLRPLATEAWVRPSGDEVPPDYKKMEGGCYW